MVGATVLGVFLQSLPPDRRVAMARVQASSAAPPAVFVRASVSAWSFMN